MGLNQVQLLGNLGQDSELKHTQSGEPVLNLRLATTESYLDRNKQRQERTDWHSVVIWGKRGEALARYLTKGTQVFIQGRIATRTYEKNGEKRYATDVVATNVVLCGGSRGGSDGRTPSTDSRSLGHGGRGNAPPPPDDGFSDLSGDPGKDDEIPF